MKDFDLRKYLSENRLLQDEMQEDIDAGDGVEMGSENWMELLTLLIGKDAYEAEYTEEEENKIQKLKQILNKMGVDTF